MKSKRFIVAVFVVLLLLFWNYGGNVHFRISHYGWYVGAGYHSVMGSDGELHRCGRSLQVGPFILDYFYSQPVGFGRSRVGMQGEERAMMYLQRSARFLEQGQLEQAMQQSILAEKERPREGLVWINRSQVQRAMGMTNESIR